MTKRARLAEPPRRRVRELVHVTVDGVTVSVFVIVWDTPSGPVLYFVPLEPAPSVGRHSLVRQLCERLLDPGQWKRALLLEPVPIDLVPGAGGPRVRVHPAESSMDPARARARLKRGDDHPVSEVARTLRAVLPVWVRGTETVATATAAPGEPGITLSVADPTGWPRTEASLLMALRAGFPQRYPLGWALLAVEAAAQLDELVAAHAELTDSGDGWYLVARPRPPEPPEPLRRLLAAAQAPSGYGERAIADVAALRTAAEAVAGDDPLRDLLRSAADKLATSALQEQMAQLAQHAPRPSVGNLDAAEIVPVTATWAGPVVREWQRTLTPVADLPATLRLPRVARLLEFPVSKRPGTVREAYLDRAGRLVLVLTDPAEAEHTPWMCAEWPCDATVAAGWTDDTVLALDRPVPGAPAGPFLALTPGDGGVRIDQVPAPPRSGGPLQFDPGSARRWWLTFRRLLKLALDNTTAVEVTEQFEVFTTRPSTAAEVADRPFVLETIIEDAGMTLWPAMTVAGDTLRWRWDTVRAAAAADLTRAQRLLAPDAPRIYRYYAIAPDDHPSIDEAWQVVRVSGVSAGFYDEEELDRSGGWERTFIIDDIGRCKRDDVYLRLPLEDVDRVIAKVRSTWTR
ncbi:hypothetical protein ACPCHT_05590 [Nucisporomicrobium flavum]|uniref:hypothetical protein n=1 Tax=Nucisporomicrobium flavum TaxID=2785915 RepID=UPI003C2E22A0